MENLDYKLNHLSLSVAERLASLLYAYKYGNKKQYFETLDNLYNVMDDNLYRFFFRFGCSSVTWKDNNYVPKEV